MCDVTHLRHSNINRDPPTDMTQFPVFSCGIFAQFRISRSLWIIMLFKAYFIVVTRRITKHYNPHVTSTYAGFKWIWTFRSLTFASFVSRSRDAVFIVTCIQWRSIQLQFLPIMWHTEAYMYWYIYSFKTVNFAASHKNNVKIFTIKPYLYVLNNIIWNVVVKNIYTDLFYVV